MALNHSSHKAGDLSPPVCASDPDEKEISDNDDDDRNHKHRRRDAGSHSSERHPVEQALTQSYRKHKRPFENGESNPQSQNNGKRDFSKRQLTGMDFPRHFGGHGSGRGRGQHFQRDSQFGSTNVASQMAHPGSITPATFTRRGLPVSNGQSAPWSGFGLIPTIPNGTTNVINSLGLPGILGPQMNSSMNMGIQRQRCRDFEELGFCLRGDICPMEHGVNRIVVEDVQSLSQFNLPLSLQNSQILAENGFVSSSGVSGTRINNRFPHSLNDMSSVDKEVLSGTAMASGPDVYDPDQPLWNYESQSSNFDGTASFVDPDLSDRLGRSSGGVGGQSTSSSVWGRLRNSKNKMKVKEKCDGRTKAPELQIKEIHELSSGIQGNFHVRNQTNGSLSGPTPAILTSKHQNDQGGSVRNLSQKAKRTLFVTCIPSKDNNRENLLSHFRKFGEVVDIFIPANSEHAFVQFSRREDAEKALKAPDAVMGSRFIKLWWANRDCIADNGVSSANNASLSPLTGKDGIKNAARKVVDLKPSDSSVTADRDFKHAVFSSPKAAPSSRKKMESLELLKEQLRKKQEMLEQKRIEFRQQLDKLAKHAPGKTEVPAEKRQVSEMLGNDMEGGNTQTSDIIIPMPSSEAVSEDKMVMENLASERVENLEVISTGTRQDPPILKQPNHPLATSGGPFYLNRYKLDNRPTTFRINAPLPCRLTKVDVLRDHFSSYGEISNIEVEDACEEESCNDVSDSEVMKNLCARISFATRYAAERAFLNGSFWQGHNLQFSWVTSSIPASSRSSGGSSSYLRATSNIEVQSAEKIVNDDSQIKLDTKQSNSSHPKSSNELSCGSSLSNGDNSLAEKHSHSEVQSPDKLTELHLLEAYKLEHRNLERQEKESIIDDPKSDQGLGAG